MTKKRNIPFGRPWIGEEEKRAVLDVLEGDVLTHGPKCKEFEQRFSSFVGPDASSISVSSGMAALHLSYFQMGLRPGDEVIVPALTHTATVHAVELMGATPVFVDCELESGNVDPKLIEPLITSRTKAIGVVHFLGIPCRMEEIMGLAKKHQLKVVEDCALAIGTRIKGKHVGLFGETGCFSFYPVKQITTGEGGMLLTNNINVANRVRAARAFGVDRSFNERAIPGYYDVSSLGLNYRMSDINAAIGSVQMERLGSILKARKKNFETLKSGLSNLEEILFLDSPSLEYENSHYCLTIVLKGNLASSRTEIIKKCKEKGIGTSIYYPQPIPRFQYYRNKYERNLSSYPNATRISDQSIALPVGPHLNTDDLDYIIKTVKRILKEYGK